MISNVACLTDYEKNAQHMLSPPMFQHINGSAQVNDYQADFSNIQMKLRGLANLKFFVHPLKHTVLGLPLNSPIGLGAHPNQAMVHPEGELASAKAAAELNQLYCLSSLSNFSIEEVVEATQGKGTMMLEVDCRLPASVREDLVRRAAAHSCFKGVVLNAQFFSDRVTEMEWKFDFEVPPHL
mmetsp:Transcript_19430/g.33055  ORF Transcript_19430/g.33055 Transcript_19430/m.33055 type:complete len:182 (-) Transcript_19430:629-1174(-)